MQARAAAAVVAEDGRTTTPAFPLSLALVVNGSRKEKFASGLLQQFLAYLKATQFHLRFLLVVSD